MKVLQSISEKDKDYYEYCKRQASIRVHMTDLADKQRVEAAYEEGQRQLLEAQAKAVEVQAKADAAEVKADAAEVKADAAEIKAGEAQAKTDAAQREVEQLRETLKAAGIDMPASSA